MQIQDCLAYLQNEVISEKIQKVMDHAERDEYINYPYNAVEEAVSNAVYHKSYAESKPIEIQVFPDKKIMKNLDYVQANTF